MKARIGRVMATALVMLGVSGCGPEDSRAENTTDSVLTPDKGEIKGTLTTLGGPGSALNQYKDKWTSTPSAATR